MSDTISTLQDVRQKVGEMLADMPKGETIEGMIVIIIGKGATSTGIVGNGRVLSQALHTTLHNCQELVPVLEDALASYELCNQLHEILGTIHDDEPEPE